MFRFGIISIIGLGSVVAANAGQIQVGGVDGLTNSYITSGCSGASCAAGSTGGVSQANYDTVLFSGTPVTAPYTTYNQTTAEQGTIVDSANNVTFSMINDGATGGGSNNFWDLPTGPVASTVTIPIGVFGVTDVWTMLNLIDASTPRDATIVFNFGTTSNATTVAPITVKIVNTVGSTLGQVRNGLECASDCGTANGDLAGPTGFNGVTTTATNLYSSFTTDGSPSGNVYLDDQGFFFNGISLASLGLGATNLNTYLVSVQIKEVSINGGGMALSALTVDTVPEPSTIALFLAGLGAIGFVRFRKARA